jgi:hypothetical protein
MQNIIDESHQRFTVTFAQMQADRDMRGVIFYFKKTLLLRM